MDEIRKVAKAYYNGAKAEDKKLAQQFFRSLDENGDGRVSLREFMSKAHVMYASDSNFKVFDANGDGTLDFDEVLGLHYMNKVSIPYCSACRDFLMGSYFSCLRCPSYALCCDCYGGRKFKHHHSSDDFADTRVMLKMLEQIMGQTPLAPSRRDILQEVRNDVVTRRKDNPRESDYSRKLAAAEEAKRILSYENMLDAWNYAEEPLKEALNMTDSDKVTSSIMSDSNTVAAMNEYISSINESQGTAFEAVSTISSSSDAMEMTSALLDIAAGLSSCAIM